MFYHFAGIWRTDRRTGRQTEFQLPWPRLRKRRQIQELRPCTPLAACRIPSDSVTGSYFRGRRVSFKFLLEYLLAGRIRDYVTESLSACSEYLFRCTVYVICFISVRLRSGFKYGLFYTNSLSISHGTNSNHAAIHGSLASVHCGRHIPGNYADAAAEFNRFSSAYSAVNIDLLKSC